MAWKKISLISLALIICGLLIVKMKHHNDETKSSYQNCIDSIIFDENGKLLSKGKYCNNEKEGLFEEYYPDRSVKWKGLYSNNTRKYLKSFNPTKCNIITTLINSNDSNIYYLKIITEGVHPSDYYIISHSISNINYSNDPNYDFILTNVNKNDSIIILNIYFFRNTEKVFISDYKLRLF